jgi:exopolysaccharide biosynthesis polyprenyl glycosylphosphotransferase
MDVVHDSAPPLPAARAEGAPRPAIQIDRRAQRRLLMGALLLLDALSLAAAFAAAYTLRFHSELRIFRDVVPELGHYLPLAGVAVVLWLGLFALAGLYDLHNLLGGTREYALVFNASAVGAVLVLVVLFLVESLIVSRGLLVLHWLFAVVFVSGARFQFRRVIYRLRRRGYFLSPVVIAGANPEGIALAEQLDEWAASGMRLVGFVDDELPAGSRVYNRLTVLGSFDALEQVVAQYGVEELVVATGSVPRERLVGIVQTFGTSPTLDIHFSSGLFEILTTGVRVQERAYVPLISLNKVRLTGIDVLLKNGLDLLIAMPLTLGLLPVMGLLAVLIRRDSPGPALHRRRVLGLHGKLFDALKFRTMERDWKQRVDCEELRNQFVVGAKPRNDPRVTRLGRFLRRYSLDELPQLFNVLKREMSLVGPRIIVAEELPFYDKLQMNLLTIRPGLTGLWQVSGRADLSYEEKVRLDMYYIRNYTIWLDLQILMRTISVVLKGKGAF